MKKLTALILAAVMMFALVACGSNGDDVTTTAAGDAAGTTAAADSDLAYVKSKGTLVVGITDFAPMDYQEAGSDEWIGFDADMAKAFAKSLGVEVKFIPIDWDYKVAELNNKSIDCVWNGMSVSPSRAEAMNLSDPYMENEMIFVVPSDSDIKSLDDIKGKTVAVQLGSTAEEILANADFANDITTTPLEDNVTALQQLELGFSDAVFMDSVVANYLITSEGKDFVILPEGLEKEEYAIGFRKGDQALRDEVQNTLSELKADGTLGEISTKWFGSDITTVK